MLSKLTSASSASRKATTSSSAKSTITAGKRKPATTSLRNSRKTKVAILPLPISSGHPIHKYAFTDRSQFDIEELAQRECKYYRITTDATIHLATDPVRRDQCFDALSHHPKILKTPCPEAIIGDNVNPLDYLAWVDRELEKTPVTFEDYALRANIAFGGALIFREYIIDRGLVHFQKEKFAVGRRTAELDADYVKNIMPKISWGITRIEPRQSHTSSRPPSRSTGSNPSASTSSTSSPTSTSSCSRVMSQQADEWMSNVLQSDLTHLRFRLLYPTGFESHNDDPAGTWSLKGVEMRKRKPTYQTTWTFPDGKNCLIPYDAQSFRALLITSEVAGEIDADDDGDDV